MTDRRSGFTLIEVMIALAILALVAVLGYRALASLTDSEARLTAEAQHWRDLDALFARLEADMREALPRDVRTGGGTEPAWFGDVDGATVRVLLDATGLDEGNVFVIRLNESQRAAVSVGSIESLLCIQWTQLAPETVAFPLDSLALTPMPLPQST